MIDKRSKFRILRKLRKQINEQGISYSWLEITTILIMSFLNLSLMSSTESWNSEGVMLTLKHHVAFISFTFIN